VQNTGPGGIGTNAVQVRLSTLRLLSCIMRSSFRVTPDYLSRKYKRAPVRWFYETNKPTL